jgi:hypothetical protein
MPKLYTSLFILLFTSLTISAQQLVTGKATLEKTDKRVYTISKIDGISKALDLDSENKNNIKGVLAVLFEDCGDIRDEIFATEYFDEKTLVKYTNSYNNCDYSSYTPTEKELESVNSKKVDQVRFYGGVELGLKNISVNSNEEDVLNQYGATIGIMASPSFMGALQGNLYFSFQATMSFGGEETFKNDLDPTSFSANTIRFILSSEYYFNKNGKIKPFAGIGFGLTRDSYEGTVSNIPFKIDGGDPIWSPKVGLLYAINSSKDIGFTFSYISEYTNDLSFPNDQMIIPLIVKSSYYNFALNFYF